MSEFKIWAVLSFLYVSCTLKPVTNSEKCLVQEQIPSMGTMLELNYTVSCDQTDRLDLILTQISSRLNEMEASMSLYQKESDISKLNEKGQLLNPPDDLMRVVQLAQQHASKTDGAFDISVWPLLKNIKESFEKSNHPPTKQELRELKTLVNYRNITLDQDRISFRKKGLQITLDGIAKGFAVDKVAEILQSRGISDYLVNFSGNIRFQGKKPNGNFWVVTVLDPVTHQNFVVPATQGAIASSGIDYNYYSKNKKWHHLIDPKMSKPANYYYQTTILGQEATVCDILSTAAFVTPPSKLKSMMKLNYPEYKYWVKTQDGRIVSNF